MNILEVVRQTIVAFCVEFVCHPYLCYTEHGQHALFYTKLYSALPEELRYATWQQKKVCVLQKEYPTTANLGKSQRQHWDVSVLSLPLTSPKTDVEPYAYDYFNLSAVIEFGMNEAREHLEDDIKRLDHHDANTEQKFIVHCYRLSEKFSRRDWSQNSGRILKRQEVEKMSIGSSVEIYYCMAGSTTDKHENGAWHIKNGETFQVK